MKAAREQLKDEVLLAFHPKQASVRREAGGGRGGYAPPGRVASALPCLPPEASRSNHNGPGTAPSAFRTTKTRRPRSRSRSRCRSNKFTPGPLAKRSTLAPAASSLVFHICTSSPSRGRDGSSKLRASARKPRRERVSRESAVWGFLLVFSNKPEEDEASSGRAPRGERRPAAAPAAQPHTHTSRSSHRARRRQGDAGRLRPSHGGRHPTGRSEEGTRGRARLIFLSAINCK